MKEAELCELIKKHSHFAPRTKPRMVTETTQFMNIKAGDVLLLNDRHYLVRGEESEGRLGLEGDPKF